MQVYKCRDCKSVNVQGKAWVGLNDGEVNWSLSESNDKEDHWCSNCSDHCDVIREDIDTEDN